MSCDSSESIFNSNRNSIISEDIPLPITGITTSSSDHDNHEAGAWSSDYSNSEDEYTGVEESVTPVSLHF